MKKKLDESDDDKDGWDWDGNKEKNKESQESENKSNASEIIRDAGLIVAGGGIIYLGYRVIRLIPSLFPPLWWTIPANVAIP